MLTGSNSNAAAIRPALAERKKALKSVALTLLMVLSTLASIQYTAVDVQAASDQDGDGLTYGLEYLMNTQPNDPDSDNDGLPDGWEWKYGLDPLSSTGADGAVADPDGDGMSNLQEYLYLQPSGWDNTNTASTTASGGTVRFQSTIGTKKTPCSSTNLPAVLPAPTGRVPSSSVMRTP
jgi:hypothetical protein